MEEGRRGVFPYSRVTLQAVRAMGDYFAQENRAQQFKILTNFEGKYS